MNRTAILYAIASAALFGASTPAAKVLLETIHPAILAGLFYCGAGIGVALLRRLRAAWYADFGAIEAKLVRADIPWLAAAVVSGGVIGPLLLMIGLINTEAAAASLLLTFEAAATALIAWFVFRENYDRRIALGMVCLVAGAIVLSWTTTPTLGSVLGALAIVGACVAWGMDNNFTRKVSLSDPLQIVEIKGLVAGPVNLAIGLWAGGALPAVTPSAIAMAIGFVGYGVSLVLFVVALRHLGTARTGAYFATAPFLGAVAAVAALGEPVTIQLAAAGALMGLGVWLHLTERHEHEHFHPWMEHTHPHTHDAHHQHVHDGSEPAGEPHMHRHVHQPLTHTHPHVPDMHHTHEHR